MSRTNEAPYPGQVLGDVLAAQIERSLADITPPRWKLWAQRAEKTAPEGLACIAKEWDSARSLLLASGGYAGCQTEPHADDTEHWWGMGVPLSEHRTTELEFVISRVHSQLYIAGADTHIPRWLAGAPSTEALWGNADFNRNRLAGFAALQRVFVAMLDAAAGTQGRPLRTKPWPPAFTGWPIRGAEVARAAADCMSGSEVMLQEIANELQTIDKVLRASEGDRSPLQARLRREARARTLSLQARVEAQASRYPAGEGDGTGSCVEARMLLSQLERIARALDIAGAAGKRITTRQGAIRRAQATCECAHELASSVETAAAALEPR